MNITSKSKSMKIPHIILIVVVAMVGTLLVLAAISMNTTETTNLNPPQAEVNVQQCIDGAQKLYDGLTQIVHAEGVIAKAKINNAYTDEFYDYVEKATAFEAEIAILEGQMRSLCPEYISELPTVVDVVGDFIDSDQ